MLYRKHHEEGGHACPEWGGSELFRAVECLVALRVVPTAVEASAAAAVTRAQMGVYVIGLYNLAGKGLPVTPPKLGAPTKPILVSGRRCASATVSVGVMTRICGLRTLTAATRYRSPPPMARLSHGLLMVPGSRTTSGLALMRGLWVVNADGGDRPRITTTDSWFEGWSPDSTRLRYRVWLVMMRVFGFRVQTGPTQSRSWTKARP